INNFFVKQDGDSHSAAQALRLSGRAFDSRLDWVVGANYVRDLTSDIESVSFEESSPSFAFVGFGAPRWNGLQNMTRAAVRTKAAFGSVEYKLAAQLSLTGGARYTDSRTNCRGCTHDNGDGRWATGINDLQFFFKNVLHLAPAPFVPIPPGGCGALD